MKMHKCPDDTFKSNEMEMYKLWNSVLDWPVISGEANGKFCHENAVAFTKLKMTSYWNMGVFTLP
jgi:hypothetical protein